MRGFGVAQIIAVALSINMGQARQLADQDDKTLNVDLNKVIGGIQDWLKQPEVQDTIE